MEFWGVEVKSGEPLVVKSRNDFILHLSQACLGEVKKDKGNESVCLSVKIADKKFVLGTLSPAKFPQLAFDLVFEQDFELSHNWKHGSVYFSGYKIAEAEGDYNSELSEPEFEIKEDLPVPADNGKPGSETKNTESHGRKAKPESKRKVKIVEPTKDERPNKDTDDSSDDEDDSSDKSSDDEESSDDQHMTANGEDEEDNETDIEDKSSDDDSDESSDEDEEPRTKQGKKRFAESSMKTPLPDKKAKLVTPQKTGTPQKTDGKKVVGHVATPHPSKQTGKTPAISNLKKEQTQKSFSCASCNRSFGSEVALQSHSKAKHSAA